MAVAVPAEPGLTLAPLTRAQYDTLVQLGAFQQGPPVELLEGALVEMAAEGPVHAWTNERLGGWLTRHLPAAYSVRQANPWVAGDLSEPEPDLAVVDARRDPTVHPSTAHLLVEVADSSRAKDLGPKARVYGAASAPVYWVVDLTRDVVHVLTEPTPDGYARREVRSFDEPLEVLGLTLVLTDVLRPPAG